VSEQESRQEFFLLRGQEAFQEIVLPQGLASVAKFGLRIFAAANPWAGVNQEAGNFPSRNSLLLFVAAKEFVSLDGGNHADGSFVARLGALHAAEAADANGSGQSDLVGKGQKNLNGRAFPDILGKKEIDTAGADVP
jgi:hypothetical protein